ncbi:MAG: hypothetical protein COB07_11900 [Sulfurovum sp.]|nr:MAG: hypothetical protein COB07_11900 [Sulfurovum sp.]
MLSSIESNIVNTVWYKKFFDASKSWLSDDEYQAMIDELNKVVQKSIDDNSDIVVAGFIPGSDWSGTVWDPIYTKACGFDFDHAAQFFGLLVCQVLIEREEEWYFIKQETAAKGMIYFRSKKKPAYKIENEKVAVKDTASFDDLKNRFGGYYGFNN